MVYYKIPLTGGLDYPAGCILVCAYTYNGYEYCKFERVTEVGSDWVKITEAEFNVRCPEFPTPTDAGHVYVEDWSDIDNLLERDVPGMAGHTERSYSLTITIGNLYGAARLTVYKGLNDDRMEEVRADLALTAGYTLHKTAFHEGNGYWAWDEWAWDNPPMEVGVEYRTTEQYQGKPVYTMLVDCGTPPNNTTKEVALPDGVLQVIEWSGFATHWNTAIPNSFAGWDAAVSGGSGKIYIKTNTDRSSGGSVYIKLKYIKA